LLLSDEAHIHQIVQVILDLDGNAEVSASLLNIGKKLGDAQRSPRSRLAPSGISHESLGHFGARAYDDIDTVMQEIENGPDRLLTQIAERRGWEVVEIYRDAGISGAKGRDGRPGLDDMLTDASRRKFDVVMAWAIDRLGRSLIDLLGSIQHLEACGVDLYLDQQNIYTTTPAGKLMFQITGAFAEFERSMIRTRVNAGLKRAKLRCRPTNQLLHRGQNWPSFTDDL
jgi:hypothetical protein